ncbi:MAG: DUF6477 family protein [Pseudomonadota bacterium]
MKFERSTPNCVKRPRLLVRAAQLVLAQNPRLKYSHSEADLAEIEESWERLRRAKDVTYSAQAHIRVLAQLLAVLEASRVLPLVA